MLGATHLLVGASLINTLRGNKNSGDLRSIFNTIYLRPINFLGYFLSFFSHFLLDVLPHYELSVASNFALGSISGLFIASMTLKRKNLAIFFAGFLGGLPDLIWLSGLSPNFNRIHNTLHFTNSAIMPSYLLAIEVLLCLLSVRFLMKKT
jgi:hypothetical protein